jgi:hypothetical protein
MPKPLIEDDLWVVSEPLLPHAASEIQDGSDCRTGRY